MWGFTHLYPCSLCGKPDSATDSQPFCGGCEEDYREGLELEREERSRNRPTCSDDCDVPHCRECGHHYEPANFQRAGRCSDCSM